MKTSSTICLLVLATLSNLQGAEFRSNDNIRVNAGDTLATDLFAGSRSVDIRGYVDGDVYAGCQTVDIDGQVAEDVIVACQKLVVRGTVGDMVIGFAQSIVIDGQVGGDVLAFCGDVKVTGRGHIKGNLYVGTGHLSLDGGRVDGWLRGGAGEAYLNGSVADSVRLEAGHVRFGKEYQAKSTKLVVASPLSRDRAKNLPDNLEIVIKEEQGFYESKFFYWSFLSMFIVGLLMVLGLKDFTRSYLAFSGANALQNSGVGLLFLIATPIAVAIFVVMVLTIPVALILSALYLILLYLSSVFAALLIGNYLLSLMAKNNDQANPVWQLLVGLALITLLAQLPYLGWLVRLAAICLGSGAVLAYLWSLRG